MHTQPPHTHAPRPPLSVVIPTWNARRFLPAVLQALRSELTSDDEIILVDNASRDHAGAWAQRHARDVRVVMLPVNRGFAGGTNAGIAVATHDLLLLCNDDALVEPGSIAALWAPIAHAPNTGAAAGVLLNSRRPRTVASAGIAVRHDGVAVDYAIGQPVATLPTTPYPVFGASGGFALLRRAMLTDCGTFAASFFNYLEDADLAWRARLRGWETYVAPGARARHVCSASGSGLKQRLLARNRLRLLVRCLPAPLLRECLPSIALYDALAVLYGLWRAHDIAAGRLAVLPELPALLRQRRTIQTRRTAPIAMLRAWLQPAPHPWRAHRVHHQMQQALR